MSYLANMDFRRPEPAPQSAARDTSDKIETIDRLTEAAVTARDFQSLQLTLVALLGVMRDDIGSRQ